MNKKNVIEIVKFAGALAIGIGVGAATRPAVRELFKLNKKDEPDMVPSEDIEEEEISEEE